MVITIYGLPKILTGSCVAAQRPRAAFGATSYYPCFTCKLGGFSSGAEGIRTPDLRRPKAALCETSALIEVPGYVDRRKLAHP